MRNRVNFEDAYCAVEKAEVKSAIADIISRGGIAEVKLEKHNDGQHITVVSQTRELIEDIKLDEV